MRLSPSMRMSEITKGSNAYALAAREASRISAAIRFIVGSVGLVRRSGQQGRSVNACDRGEPCRENGRRNNNPAEDADRHAGPYGRGLTGRRVGDEGDMHHDSKVRWMSLKSVHPTRLNSSTSPIYWPMTIACSLTGLPLTSSIR